MAYWRSILAAYTFSSGDSVRMSGIKLSTYCAPSIHLCCAAYEAANSSKRPAIRGSDGGDICCSCFSAASNENWASSSLPSCRKRRPWLKRRCEVISGPRLSQLILISACWQALSATSRFPFFPSKAHVSEYLSDSARLIVPWFAQPKRHSKMTKAVALWSGGLGSMACPSGLGGDLRANEPICAERQP